MKILELRFKNLNSLSGEWIIDFTEPEYVSNGIFALTGPTGAGKSTILDAICLALYGATPRLGKITKSANEIMSRQTGECFAEVLFESQAGRFRCHWEQRRARKKAGGNLQDQEHQIADADTGRLIETKKSRVGAVIEDKTGMDFERFTRSILLAQGGFDTFLKADAEQKSRILEQITGTSIYSEISRRVHERLRDEREKLEILNAEISGIQVLEPQQEQEIRDELAARQQQEAQLAAQVAQTGAAITWLTGIENLCQDIRSLEDEAAGLNAQAEAFAPERKRLELATRAASLDGVHATLTALRTQQAQDQASLKTAREHLPELERSARLLAQDLEAAEKQRCAAREDLDAAAPLIQEIRLLDQKIADQTSAVAAGAGACAREAAQVEMQRQARSGKQQECMNAQKALEAAQAYLRDNARDEWLVAGLAGIQEQFGSLLARQREIAHRQAELARAEAALAEAVRAHEAARAQSEHSAQELQAASQNLQHGRHALDELLAGKLLREYRAEKDSLLREMAYIRKIEELEEYRARLQDGTPCPLCGSTEHPFARGNVPVPDAVEQQIASLTSLITGAEEQEVALGKLERAHADARTRVHEREKLEAATANDTRAARNRLAELQHQCEHLQASFDELKQQVCRKLEPLGIPYLQESELGSQLESLRSRLQAWQQQVHQKADIEKQIAAIDGELKRLDAVIDTQAHALGVRQHDLEQRRRELEQASRERRELFGDKQPDREKARLDRAIADAEKQEKKIRDQCAELQQKLATTVAQVESLNTRIAQRATELRKAEADFLAALVAAGFADERCLVQARLPYEARESLSARARELDTAWTQLNARRKDRETHLAEQRAQKLTDRTLEELQPQFSEYEQSLKTLRDTIAGLRHRLNENSAARQRIQHRQSGIEAQKKECRRWEKLQSLIGSSDGKKYRNFAQGLTFELMVSHANCQLMKMTDRYLLIRDAEHPLELCVVDNYQAGEIRSTRNLSGGESFLVSLTLALGLSRMASSKVRVDSLFLDEGFGTLDEDALDTALETLSGLQQDGKLIGIISHVSALKDRISTQIRVTPLSGGRSSLSGPGCARAGSSPGA